MPVETIHSEAPGNDNNPLEKMRKQEQGAEALLQVLRAKKNKSKAEEEKIREAEEALAALRAEIENTQRALAASRPAIEQGAQRLEQLYGQIQTVMSEVERNTLRLEAMKIVKQWKARDPNAFNKVMNDAEEVIAFGKNLPPNLPPQLQQMIDGQFARYTSNLDHGNFPTDEARLTNILETIAILQKMKKALATAPTVAQTPTEQPTAVVQPTPAITQPTTQPATPQPVEQPIPVVTVPEVKPQPSYASDIEISKLATEAGKIFKTLDPEGKGKVSLDLGNLYPPYERFQAEYEEATQSENGKLTKEQYRRAVLALVGIAQILDKYRETTAANAPAEKPATVPTVTPTPTVEQPTVTPPVTQPVTMEQPAPAPAETPTTQVPAAPAEQVQEKFIPIERQRALASRATAVFTRLDPDETGRVKLDLGTFKPTYQRFWKQYEDSRKERLTSEDEQKIVEALEAFEGFLREYDAKQKENKPAETMSRPESAKEKVITVEATPDLALAYRKTDGTHSLGAITLGMDSVSAHMEDVFTAIREGNMWKITPHFNGTLRICRAGGNTDFPVTVSETETQTATPEKRTPETSAPSPEMIEHPTNWQEALQNAFNGYRRLSEQFAANEELMKTPAYERFHQIFSTYLETYERIKTSGDEMLMRAFTQEFQKAVSNFENAFKTPASLTNKMMEWVNGVRQKVTAGSKEAFLDGNFKPESTPAQIKEMLERNASMLEMPQLSPEQLHAVLFMKAYLPTLAGEDGVFNRDDLPAVARDMANRLTLTPEGARELKQEMITNWEQMKQEMPELNGHSQQEALRAVGMALGLPEDQLTWQESSELNMAREMLAYHKLGWRILSKGWSRLPRLDAKIKQYWKAESDLQQVERLRQTLPQQTFTQIFQRLSKGMDDMRVDKPAGTFDLIAHPISKQSLEEFERQADVIRTIGRQDMAGIEKRTGKRLESFSPEGMDTRTVDSLLASFNGTTPTFGSPKGATVLIWDPKDPTKRQNQAIARLSQ